MYLKKMIAEIGRYLQESQTFKSKLIDRKECANVFSHLRQTGCSSYCGMATNKR